MVEMKIFGLVENLWAREFLSQGKNFGLDKNFGPGKKFGLGKIFWVGGKF